MPSSQWLRVCLLILYSIKVNEQFSFVPWPDGYSPVRQITRMNLLKGLNLQRWRSRAVLNRVMTIADPIEEPMLSITCPQDST
jgi:hypothetical protein